MIKKIIETVGLNEGAIEKIRDVAYFAYDNYGFDVASQINDVLAENGYFNQFGDDRIDFDELEYIYSELTKNKYDGFIISGDSGSWVWAYKKSALKKTQKEIDDIINNIS